MEKRGAPSYVMIAGVVIYIISILMPWITIGFGNVPGYAFRSYLLLILFIYPIYTVIRNVYMNPRYGAFCGIIPIGVLGMLYINITGDEEELEVAVAKATFGYYTAIVGVLLFLVGVFMKIRKQNRGAARNTE